MSLKIYAVGDIMLGEQPLTQNFGVGKIIRDKGIDYLFQEIEPLFADGDIVFGNLECSFGENKNKKNSNFFSADPSVVNGLKNAHFNVLSVANNHTLENGQIQFEKSIQLLKNHQIAPVGIKKQNKIINVKGHKIAFLAYSLIKDPFSDSCYNKIPSDEEIINDIQQVKSLSDLIIISLHWGYEYVPCPSPDQIQVGRHLVDAGADIILGGHPHIPQSYEIYKKRPIFYSLGNFIFDQTFIPSTKESFIAKITIDETLRSFEIDIIPFSIDDTTYCPHLIKGSQKIEFINNTISLRKLFENRQLSEYENLIGSYSARCNLKKREANKRMKIHFIKNFFRYSFSTDFSIIKKYLFRK